MDIDHVMDTYDPNTIINVYSRSVTFQALISFNVPRLQYGWRECRRFFKKEAICLEKTSSHICIYLALIFIFVYELDFWACYSKSVE